jgi:hypothetical protein
MACIVGARHAQLIKLLSEDFTRVLRSHE